MANIFDVAEWFLSRDTMTHKKLQKLCYYYKAWGAALYAVDVLPCNQFQAWVHGPVCPELYDKYKDYYWNDIPKTHDNSSLFSPKELDLLESVWLTYGDMSANALEAQTHVELPWRNARKGVSDLQHSTNEISFNDMKDYYRAIYREADGE